MNLFTRIIASIRYPESALGKTLQRIVPIVLLMILVLFGLSGFATYRIVAPTRLAETIDPSSFLLRNFQSLPFQGSGGRNLEGWFIPSVRGGPVVFLCHGYKSNRSELLTLASTFQENGYNLFLFDFRAHGTSPASLCSLGIRETEDLLSAIHTVSARPDVDSNRAGIWGVSLGAYVALSTAVLTEKVKTLVLDSPFESPARFIEMQTPEILGVDNFVFNKLARFGFFLVNLPKTAPSGEALIQSLTSLKGRDKLFITSEEAPTLETQTLNLFNHTPEPKELLRLKRSKTSILYDVDRKNYENTIVEFFREHLPVRGGK
ncbi:MAG: alpha/beta fold hydrolase [Acidobacteria bacterium]|nr:alpha/beta fold hydrolase [Acidobacteriota bacterium]MCI0620975.1 alpha/beta fold hydrolase [Acidobacteriota bacterium]MCI0719889.1 alpha/beta fold hydrolase [Acidobacteriota bacterium]